MPAASRRVWLPFLSDRVITVTLVALAAAAAVFAVFFAYTLWADRRAELASTPAGRAIVEVRSRVKASPNDAALRVRFGEALASAGLLDEAVEQFTEALKVDELHTGALLDLGLVAMQRGETKAAQGFFLRIAEISGAGDFAFTDERLETALFQLGEIALAEKRYEDAIGYLKAALRIRKDAADTYFDLGLAYQGIDQDQLAEEQFEIALLFDPAYAQAHYELGTLLLDRGDEPKAAAHLGKAAELAPNNDLAAEAVEKIGPSDRRLRRAKELLAEDDLDGALDEALIANALDPRSLEAIKLVGTIYEKRDETKLALAAFRDADALAPDDRDVDAAIARLTK